MPKSSEPSRESSEQRFLCRGEGLTMRCPTQCKECAAFEREPKIHVDQATGAIEEQSPSEKEFTLPFGTKVTLPMKPAPKEKDGTAPRNDCVICPACCHQFGAISVDDQQRRSDLEQKLAARRPYSDKLAQEVIAEQVKDIDRLHRELAAARQRLDWTIEDNAKKAVRIADMEAAQSATATPWVVDCLRLAIRQNSHDMLLTGDEIRRCEAALAAADNRSADKGQG